MVGAVPLPVLPPLPPMLAKRLDALPSGDFLFEPKWDGFRTLVFRDGDDVQLQSRDLKPLARYFPEVVAACKAQLPARCVLDGEIVIATPKGLDFDLLQQRLHPAASRVKKLSEEIPASIVFWDVLAHEDEDLRGLPLHARRARLEALLAGAHAPVHVTPCTTDRALAADWFDRFEGAGLDGVMAKPREGVYEPDKRTMFKVKHERTCECVVAGFRWHAKKGVGEGTAVGSLLLGLFGGDGRLHHVGVTATFTDKRRRELVEELAPYRANALEGHPWAEWAAPPDPGQRVPGQKSRWSQGKTLEWEPLRCELVVEVAYDHLQGDRFRHTAQFRRFRVDKAPADCRYDQLESTTPYELAAIFGAG